MTEAISYRQNFLQKYSNFYPAKNIYFLLNNNSLLATSSFSFCCSHPRLINNILTTNTDKILPSHAYLSEYITALALEPLLKPHSYRVDLAPQSLEHGVGQRGVDLLILDQRQKIMLGLDIKLRTIRSSHNRNGGRWLDNLKAPFINLSLGNWSVHAKDPQVKNIKDWLIYSVLPNIPDNGQIPQLNDFRSYIVPRIKNSLQLQQENFSNHKLKFYSFPQTRQEIKVYQQKLSGLIEIFSDIEARINIQ
jgi:hypothetical protein